MSRRNEVQEIQEGNLEPETAQTAFLGGSEVDCHSAGKKRRTGSNAGSTGVIFFQRVTDCLIQRRGILLTLVSATAISCLVMMSKFLSNRVSANVLHFYYSTSFIAYSGPFLVSRKIWKYKLTKKMWLFLLLRGVSGAATGIMYFYSIQLLDISTAQCLFYLMPVFTAIFARLFLKESFSFPTVIFSCVCVIGIFLVVQPRAVFGDASSNGEAKDSAKFSAGIACALAVAVMYGIVMTTLRKLGTINIDPHLVLFVFGVCNSCLSVVMTSARGEWRIPDCTGDRLFLIMIGCAGYLEMLALTCALQTENAAVVSVVRSTDIIITFVLDIIVLNATANLFKIGGVCLVLTSSAGITVTNFFRASSPPAMRDK